MTDNGLTDNWLTDSRQPLDSKQAANTVFFAIRGEHHDGHAFIGDLYQRGVRQFVVERNALAGRRTELATYHDARFVEVDSSLQTLQDMAAEHRAAFGRAAFGRAAFGRAAFGRAAFGRAAGPPFRFVGWVSPSEADRPRGSFSCAATSPTIRSVRLNKSR